MADHFANLHLTLRRSITRRRETTTQIDLDERSSAALDAIARETGKTPDQLIHEAVEDLIRRHQPLDRKDLILQARGMWKDREDLPDFDLIRGELDRS